MSFAGLTCCGGGDVRKFHPPSGRFDGVIGGPPCQRFSPLSNIVRKKHGEDSVAPDLFPEYQRVIGETQPEVVVPFEITRRLVPLQSSFRGANRSSWTIGRGASRSTAGAACGATGRGPGAGATPGPLGASFATSRNHPPDDIWRATPRGAF